MYARNETPPEIISIAPVLDFALQYNPDLAYKDISTVTFWIASGCDIEKDILPAMKKICEWKKGVSSFNYFTKPVTAARDVRIAKAKLEAEKPAIDCEAYIKIYQWKRDRNMPLKDAELKALQEYENGQCGRI